MNVLEEKLEAVSVEDGKKKKKTRSKPGRHRMIKARVELREKWQAGMLSERETPCVGGEFDYGDREGMSDRDEASKQEGLTGTKVFHPNSHFYPAFLHLTSHFPHKVALMDARAPRHSEKPFFRGLSRKLSSLLRHELPSVGVPYNSLDGSANLEDVAKHLDVSPSAIATASLPSEDGKRRMLLFETMFRGHRERRILALGGHGFAVLSPLGHWPISKTGALLLEKLIHETDKASEIQSCGFISGMFRFGGVNFTVSQRGGYRKKANSLVTISPENLSAAIADGFEFFENRFNGIVYGAGQWQSDKWEGRIPQRFLDFSFI